MLLADGHALSCEVNTPIAIVGEAPMRKQIPPSAPAQIAVHPKHIEVFYDGHLYESYVIEKTAAGLGRTIGQSYDINPQRLIILGIFNETIEELTYFLNGAISVRHGRCQSRGNK